jgi:hypothetical protein
MTLKLGPHHLSGGETDTLEWLRLKPAVAKVYACGFELAAARSPETLFIGRPEEHFLKSLSGDPAALARQMAAEVYAPLSRMYPGVQAWEGPNEVNPGNVAEMQWYSAFLARLGYEINALGHMPVMGAWAVGTPEQTMWGYYRPVLEMLRDTGGLHSRHCYGPLNRYYALRYRDDQAAFRALGFDPRVVITECGADFIAGDPVFTGGWRRIWASEREYWANWLRPFKDELDKDAYVLGATVFTVGTGFSEHWQPYVVGRATLDCIVADCPPEEEAHMVVISKKGRANKVTIYDAPGSDAQHLLKVTWDMEVVERVVDDELTVWLKVNAVPPMWVTADQVVVKV